MAQLEITKLEDLKLLRSRLHRMIAKANGEYREIDKQIRKLEKATT